jgi:hypothetical protein
LLKLEGFVGLEKSLKTNNDRISKETREEVNSIFENKCTILNYEPKLNLLGLDMLLGRFMCTPDHWISPGKKLDE